MKPLSAIRLLAVAAVLVAGTAYTAPVRTEHVEAELVAEKTALVPGQPTTVALRLKLDDGWHTYWRNPGDSGLPTTIAWKLPEGYKAGEIEWPAPRALPVGPLVNYGYEGEVLHLVTLTPPAMLAPGGAAEIAARADWLVCRETCIPDGADLRLALPVAERADTNPKWGAAIAATRAALPRPLPGWTADAQGDGQKVKLALAPPPGAGNPGAIRFFPFDEGRIEPSAPQTLAPGEAGRYVLTLPVAHQLAPGFTRLAGVLTADKGFASGGGSVKAAALDIPLAGAVVAGPKPNLAIVPALDATGGSRTSLSLAGAALLALLGGIVLNLMPCVFPVLSLKALALAGARHTERSLQRASGVIFAAGVITAFLALAVLLLAFRAAGEQVGWGFQLQSPAVVTGLAVLFFVLALNLSGAFEFATLFPGAAGWTMKNRHADAFLSGMLAVVIASPCTAPFMGAALGFALAQPASATLAIFVALGIGMALPFLLLSWFPGWRRVLPRPGPWMERLRQFLAFPLYATVAWLAWVIGAQIDNDAVVRLLATLVIVALALWAWRTSRFGGGRPWSIAAAAAALGAFVLAWPLLRGDAAVEAAAPRAAKSGVDAGWLPYTPARLAELTAAGRPVFVDFTAAWCVTCQVNKRLVLNDADVRDAFARSNVTLVRADWTRRDPAITQALAALGRNGVPVYVLYRPGREPLLLPEVLQKQMIVDALSTLDSKEVS